MARCPHTMRATNAKGEVTCCDCGKVFYAPIKAIPTADDNDALCRKLRIAIDGGFEANITTAKIADAYIKGPIAKHTAALRAELDEARKLIDAAAAAPWKDHPIAELANLQGAIVAAFAAARTANADAKGNAFALEHLTHVLTKAQAAEARIAELEKGLRVGLEALGKVVAEEWMADKARIAELEAENDRLLIAMTGG